MKREGATRITDARGFRIRRNWIKAEDAPTEYTPVPRFTDSVQVVEPTHSKSQDEESMVPSKIRERVLYTDSFRPRVDIEEPHSMEDVARNFFVLRLTALNGNPPYGQESFDEDA
jgi:hypothetical protein